MDNDETPYDNLWSWLAAATFGVTAAAAVYVRTGGFTIWPDAGAAVQDDAAVTAAYWGLLLGLAGLFGLGLLALRFLSSAFASPALMSPRLNLVEGKIRDPLIAAIALAAVTLVPVVALGICLDTYVAKSRIACWNAETPLADGFLDSRMRALPGNCAGKSSFRLAPKEDPKPYAAEWFPVGDLAIVGFAAGAVISWLLAFRRRATLRRRKQSDEAA